MTFSFPFALPGRPSPPRSPQPRIMLRALLQRPRSLVLPELEEVLLDADCWTVERCESAAGLCLHLELSLRMVSEFYTGLVECGLEFDCASHRALATLCTLRRHALMPGRPGRPVELQMEILFADAVEPGTFPRCRPQA